VILVDTSVLIDYLKGKENNQVKLLDEIIEKKISFGISPFVFQEVLQGTKDQKEFDLLKEYLETIPLYNLLNGLESYAEAARINFKCRKSGITIRSTIDLLIVQTTIENKLFLLHNDSDFDHVQKVVEEFKIYK